MSRSSRGGPRVYSQLVGGATALEGNTLTPRELYRLVEQDRVTGNKEMRYYLEIQGYAQVAKWVYEQAVESARRKDFKITNAHISEISIWITTGHYLQKPAESLFKSIGTGTGK